MASSQGAEEIRQNLTRRDLSSAAIALIERDGLGALTMRRLATDLDCAPMSLYTHVRNRDDLIDAIVDELIERLDLREPRGEGWQQIVFQTFSAYRDLAVQLPNSFELLALAPYDTSPVAPHLARFVAGLEAAGLTTEQAQQILGIADAYASGFLVVWARSQARGESADPPAASASDGITGLRDLATFDRGLDALLAGLDATLVRGIAL